MKRIKVASFFNQLLPLVTSGIPLSEALELLIKKPIHSDHKNILTALLQNIQAGKSFSTALATFPKIFSTMDIALIQAGEETGRLAELIQQTITFRKQSENTSNQIKKALFYPMIVLVAAAFITLGLLIFIIPQFQEVFASFNTPLPWLTQQVILLSEFLKYYGLVLLLLIAMLIAGMSFSIKRFEKIKRRYQNFILKLPLIGKLIWQTNISLHCTILSIADRSGIPLINSIDLAKQATPYIMLQEKLQQCQTLLKNGERFSHCWDQLKLADSDAIALLAVGENTGKLSEMLHSLAKHYYDKTQHFIDYLSQLIEPTIMMLLAIITGSLIIAMYLPIFNMGAIIQ